MAPYTATVDPDEFEQWAKNSLEADIALMSKNAGTHERLITSELVHGRATDVLLTRAAYADLLVVGNRGRGGFKGLLLGSVSQHCAAHAPVPVVVVRRDRRCRWIRRRGRCRRLVRFTGRARVRSW